MTERQLRPTGVATFSCHVCRQPFSDRSNRRRHMARKHPEEYASAEVRGVFEEKSEALEGKAGALQHLQTRHYVDVAVGELLSGNFTRPATELTALVRGLLPSFTEREAEILVASTSSATRQMTLLHQTMAALQRSGGPTSAAERDITRRLAYLALGPRWATAPATIDTDDASSTPSVAPPARSLADVGADAVRSWLEGSDIDPAAGARQSAAELIELAAPMDVDLRAASRVASPASVPAPPPPPPKARQGSTQPRTQMASRPPQASTTDRLRSPVPRRRSPSPPRDDARVRDRGGASSRLVHRDRSRERRRH